MFNIQIDQRPTSELLQARNCLAHLQACADAMADKAYGPGWVITIDMLLRARAEMDAEIKIRDL
jgi:hypothetical protein